MPSAAGEAAFEAYAAGLCVVPPREDGSKRPDVRSWNAYQVRRPTSDELEAWYAGGRTGVGVVCGRVSGGLEMLEFEGRAVSAGVLEQFLILAQASGLGPLIERIRDGYTERTPLGGIHWLYHVTTPKPNTKLAARPATEEELAADAADGIKVLIETRGEGGYTIIAPSNGRVHPTGGAWALETGGLDSIATITDAERDDIFDVARLLDAVPGVLPRERYDYMGRSGDRPGDRYNLRPDIQQLTLELLVGHGWTWVYQRADGVDLLRRPGKDVGVSATLGHAGPGVLYVFTSSSVFDPGAYSAFRVMAKLEHDDDWAAAAKALEPPIIIGRSGASPKGRERAAPHERTAQLRACVATVREWLHMPDPGALYMTLATVVANRAPGDPVWLLVVGPPGGGKTEIINSIVRQHDVHPAATLTEAALLSGVPKRDHAAASKGGLLREIGDFGILLNKDFGSVLSMNRDARAATLAAFREVYDGSWTRHVGSDGGRTLSWTGKVGLIAGCTPAIDSHHAVIGSMGERFVTYRLPPVDADAQARRALGHVGREASMRDALATAVDAVLALADDALAVTAADEDTTDRLVRIATLAVRCRSAVERDSYSREVQLIPEAEAPARLALVLLRLRNALAAIGVDDTSAWRLVTKTALDSMPAVRRSALEYLMGCRVPVNTSDVAQAMDYPTTTARRALEDLAAHGIAHRESGGSGRADLWTVTDWARGRWPTVPEMSGKEEVPGKDVPGTSADLSGDDRSDHGPSPFSLPLRTNDDFSGTVPDAVPPYEPELATDDDAEVEP